MFGHHCVTITFLQVLLITTWCSATTTYYVKPTFDTLCPATPCLTLSEYARMSDQYFAPNTTMVFLPGNHSINASFFTVNLTRFEMHGDQSLLPAVTTQIVCTGPMRFYLNNISAVRVSTLTFVACALDVEDVQDFKMVDCSLEDSLFASALAAINADLSIVRTSFVNNVATYFGGGLFAYNSNVNLKDSEFALNYAYFGGAVYASNSNISVNGSNVLNNYAGGIGGGFFFLSSVVNMNGFNNIQGNIASQGGGISVQFSSVTFNGTNTFTANAAHRGIFFFGPPVGGAFDMLDSDVIFNGSTHFVSNSAGQGGGVIAQLGSIMFCGETTFISNSVLINGNNGLSLLGGAMLLLDTSLSFDGKTTVWSNFAFDDGGGLHAINTSLSFKGTNDFSNNLSFRLGGGITLQFSTLYFSGTTLIIGNTAVQGGGVYIVQGDLLLEGTSTFANNSVDNFRTLVVVGGGLTAANSSINITGRHTFTNNSAEEGGGIFVQKCNISLKGDTTFEANYAQFGGGMSMGNSSLNNRGTLSFISNSASSGGGGLFGADSYLEFAGNTTFFNNFAPSGGGIYIATHNSSNQSNVVISGVSSFISNYARSGGAIWMADSIIQMSGSTTCVNNSAMYGGAIEFFLLSEYTEIESVIVITGTNIFIGNSADKVGGALYVNGGSLTLNGYTTFMENSAGVFGGGIDALNSAVDINGEGIFHNNSANTLGGAIQATDCNFTITGNATFQNNFAGTGGAFSLLGKKFQSRGTLMGSFFFVSNSAIYLGGSVFIVNDTILSISGNTTFLHNLAQIGSSVFSGSSKVNINGTTDFFNNTVINAGTVAMLSSHLTCIGNTTFRNNIGSSIFAAYSNISFYGITTFFRTMPYTGPLPPVLDDSIIPDFLNSQLKGSGMLVSVCNVSTNGITYYIGNAASGVVAFQSDLSFNGINWFVNNSAINGGGVSLFDSTLGLNGNATIENNVATSQGGGIYALRSDVNVFGTATISTNSAGIYGGGIHAVASKVALSGEASFVNNIADLGGALSLAFSSSWYILGSTKVLYDTNRASRGGAIHVADTVDSFGCAQNPDLQLFTTGECFFQIFNPDSSYMSLNVPPDTTFSFQDNTVSSTGTILYGGLLDRCVLNSFSPLRQAGDNNDPVALFKSLSNISNSSDNESAISSDPMRVCFCQNNLPNCTFEITELSVKRGEVFSVSALAVDQVGNPLPATVRSYLPSQTGANAELGEGVDIQQSNETCTDLKFRVFSPDMVEELVLYADGPCRDLGTSRRSINVTFLPCPVGFELSSSKSECVCEDRLQRFTNTCNIDDESFRRGSDFWVTYHNESPTGLILHPHCPFDYCQTVEVTVRFDDLDTQCAYDRSGFLCGRCKDGLSHPFGSSRCLPCSNAYISITITFIVAGILLVALLLICKLTVVDGDLSGLILYANIVAVNKAIFFPSGETNILTVFIAWVNLDLGIETCFYNGMDAYARTWLQFVFPVYVWILVGLIIVVSHYSTGIVVKILGRNPVAVLATLFLLSYAKMLRTIITAFSFTFLEYPDESSVPVWLLDGNIGYLNGKHIPLFVAALVALLFLFLPYTLFLLMGHWLQAWSHIRILSWANHRMLKPFMDAYHAPYQLKHRYWTGLLLLLRCALFLTFAFNALGDASINLLAIASASLGLVVLTRLTGSIYKKWYIEALESSFILNLGILAGATYHIRLAGGNQAAVAYTSVGIAFSTFIGILFYHVIRQLKDTRCMKTLQLKMKAGTHQPQTAATPGPVAQNPGGAPVVPVVTTTFIDLREPLLEEH